MDGRCSNWQRNLGKRSLNTADVNNVYHLSRGEAKKLFDAEKITVNGRLCKNPETVLKENSKISARGYGKLEYRGEEHTTKKGKTGITIWRYV